MGQLSKKNGGESETYDVVISRNVAVIFRYDSSMDHFFCHGHHRVTAFARIHRTLAGGIKHQIQRLIARGAFPSSSRQERLNLLVNCCCENSIWIPCVIGCSKDQLRYIHLVWWGSSFTSPCRRFTMDVVGVIGFDNQRLCLIARQQWQQHP